VHPGILVSNIGHLKEILVEAALLKGIHKDPLVGLWGTGGHHNPVKFLFLYPLFNPFLGILGTGKKVHLGINNVG